MENEKAEGKLSQEYWHLNLDWFRGNDRSLAILAQDCLCPKCRKLFQDKEPEAEEVVKVITSCCSQREGFLTPNMPLMACIFRIFLANGNQSLSLEELASKLAEYCYANTRSIVPETLLRILRKDYYYGLTPAT